MLYVLDPTPTPPWSQLPVVFSSDAEKLLHSGSTCGCPARWTLPGNFAGASGAIGGLYWGFPSICSWPPLDVRSVAAVAHISPAHFSRCFRAVFGETPHRYLQRRRMERSMFLLRETDRCVTEICFDVGFTSLGTFRRTFKSITGETPSGYRRGNGPIVVPHSVQMACTRPGSYGWLTVRVPGEGGTEISLEQPGPPLHDEATAEQLRELVTKGALGGLVLTRRA